jgi:predicted TIM-barrel fold metal-dependent hydrolase
MVLVAGQQGRPTAGVTWTTNSVSQLILGASNQKLSLERMYIAPHAQSFTVKDPDDLDAGSGRILFGSDFPYAPADVGASFTAKLDAYDGLTADEHRAISHGNAWTLFPRLAA